jgi:hypothetical protein
MGFYRVIITNDDIRELFGNKFYELSAQKSFFVLVVFENIFFSETCWFWSVIFIIINGVYIKKI